MAAARSFLPETLHEPHRLGGVRLAAYTALRKRQYLRAGVAAAGAAERVQIPPSLQRRRRRRRHRLARHAVLSAVLGRDLRHAFAEIAGRRLQPRLHHFQRARDHGPGRAGQPETANRYYYGNTSERRPACCPRGKKNKRSSGYIYIVTLRIRDG